MRRLLASGIAIGLMAVLMPLVSTSQGGAVTLPGLALQPGFDIAGPSTSQMTFTAELSAPATTTVSVTYATINGTAIAGTNYDATTGTLSIPAGSTSGSIAVTILAQEYAATTNNLTFDVKLSDATGAQLKTAKAVGTIDSDPYFAAASGLFEDAVIDPASKFAYISNRSDNEVDVLDLSTGAYEKPIKVGSEPMGLDITQNGKRLYVCDFGAQAISVVNLQTDKTVKTIVTPKDILSDTAYWIALANDNEAVFTDTFEGSGFGAHAYLLNLKTDAFTILGGNELVTEATQVVRSADYSTVAGVLGDDSGGPFFVYHAATGSVTTGGVNSFVQWGALNADGTKLLIDPGTRVIDTSTGSLLGTIASSNDSGVAIAPAGHTAYSLGNGVVNVLNLNRFLQTSTIPAPNATGSGILVMSPDGTTLVALSGSGATIIKV